MKYLLIVFSLLLFSAPISAQSISDNFKTYIIKNDIYTQALDKKFKDMFEYAFPECNQNIEITRLNPKTLLPFIHLETQNVIETHPHHGQWIESAIGGACDQSSIFNLLVTAYNSEKEPVLYPLINGKTQIDPLAQSNAEQSVYNALDCRTTKIVMNTKFLGYRSEDGKKLSVDDNNLGWFEQWIVDGCNSIQTVNLAILPDPKTKYRYVAKAQ